MNLIANILSYFDKAIQLQQKLELNWIEEIYNNNI